MYSSFAVNDEREENEKRRRLMDRIYRREEELELANSFGSRDDVDTGMTLVVVHVTFTMVVFVAYLLTVSSKYSFRYGYADPNSGGGPPGYFLDERFSFLWFLFFLNCMRALHYYLYLWIADCRLYSYWLFTLQKVVAVVYVIFDVVYLVDLLILGVQCNASYFPSNPCNDPNGYCKAYQNENQCPPSAYDPSYDPNDLRPNRAFVLDFWFAVAFGINDIVILASSGAFRLTVRRFAQIYFARLQKGTAYP